VKNRIVHKILSILKIKFLEVLYLAPNQVTAPLEFDTAILTAERLRELARSGLLVYGEEDISRIEKSISICIAVFDQKKLAGVCWYAIKGYPHTVGYIAHIHPDYMCGYGLQIMPEYQGRGIHGVLVATALDWMSSNNKKGLLLAINFDNYASRKSAEKIGFRRLGLSFYSAWIKGAAGIRQYYFIDLG